MEKTLQDLLKNKNFKVRENFACNNFISNKQLLQKQINNLHENQSANYNSIVINHIKNTIRRIEKDNKDLYLARLKVEKQINKDNIL
jgi:formylmethanofuran dehydrogenase subunit E-like metal-binding protein